ncbi:sulfotransferase family protein [Qipengyuania sp. 1XM1-15A]|uniref:sulfotransferase family 2 domain-containing protein n=1 Tax=Qipengyuania xiamenensis TaxID=2867237 RepID=UPI001C8769F3|nr:sulfotransferase family 2 domain-containing protein [Qipengyuania xiamenensis]MBX7531768.1 sulfotransferase family protein [Qipengyuania xiamenensis]
MPFFRLNNRIILYAHVPKSGGTTVNRRLREAGMELAFFDGAFWTSGKKRWNRSSPQHISNADRDLLFPEGFFDYTFTVVRDPVSRFLSAFNHNRGRIGHHVSFDRFLSRMERQVAEEDDYFGHRFDNHFLPSVRIVPQQARVFRLEDGMDAVFEGLHEDLGILRPTEFRVDNKRGYEVAPSSSAIRTLIKRVISSPSPKPEMLSHSQQARIRALYEEDFAAFYPQERG